MSADKDTTPVSGDLSPEAERAIRLEERAHRLRLAMLRTPGLLERVADGRDAAERGEVVTLDELDRELGAAEHEPAPR